MTALQRRFLVYCTNNKLKEVNSPFRLYIQFLLDQKWYSTRTMSDTRILYQYTFGNDKDFLNYIVDAYKDDFQKYQLLLKSLNKVFK